MLYSRWTRNCLAVRLSIALAMAVVVCACTPTATHTPPPELTEAQAPNTPTGTESPPSTSTAAPQPSDQEQTAVDPDNETVIGGSVDQRFAQVFTVAQSGFISHLALLLDCQPSASLSVQIEDASGGAPGGQVLASEVVSGSGLSSYRGGVPGHFSIIVFGNPPAVSAGASYAFVLETFGGDCGL